MGYERSKKELKEVNQKIYQLKQEVQRGKSDIPLAEIGLLEEVYKRASNSTEITREIQRLLQNGKITMPKASLMDLISEYNSQRKYEFYIREAEKSAKKSEKIIVISDAQKEKFGELFPYAAHKVVLLENGYDPKTFYEDDTIDKSVIDTLTSDRSEDGKISPDYDSLILFVGKFADFKGIDSILTAAKIYEDKMQEKGNKPLTLIVGSGALENKLKAQAEQLALKNTHFTGRKGHDVICKLQNLADVSLIPSRDEPFGLVVIEGTACGHPVIGSNSGGIPGILNTTKASLPTDQDIIQTSLGLLIKPLPERPQSLNDIQKDELDIITTDYVVADKKKRGEILVTAKEKFNLEEALLKQYFEEYVQSTNALSNAVMQIIEKEVTFDNHAIASYTKENYSQEVIRDKLFEIFDEAEQLKKVKEDSYHK